MKLSLTIASANDAGKIAILLSEAAQHLTASYGKGQWSHQSTEKGVLYGMRGNSKVLMAMNDNRLVGTLRLTTKKPWAIAIGYFTKVDRPLYLVDMAVHPDKQKNGIGEYMLQQAKKFVEAWPAQCIRLDAYNDEAGAGEFYRKCGFSERGRVVYRGNPLIYFELLM